MPATARRSSGTKPAHKALARFPSNDTRQTSLPFKWLHGDPRGLIVDLFAGGGGTSMGVKMAFGREPDIAINHSASAIAMHAANHPNTIHYQEDVFAVDPATALAGNPVFILSASPDCRHFSPAKGGALVDRRIRGLIWVVLHWVSLPEWQRPRFIMIENVPAIQSYGPLIGDPDGDYDWRQPDLPKDPGTPDSARAGQYYRQFLRDLASFGYTIDTRVRNAADDGAPTIRTRWWLIARFDGQPIRWPEATYAPRHDASVAAGLVKPWRPVADCIDFNDRGTSIFARKKDLAEKSQDRLAHGVHRYVIGAADPFIVTCNHGGHGFRGQEINSPFLTVTAARDAHGIVTALGTPLSPTMNADQPAAGPAAQIASAAFLQTYYGTKKDGSGAARGQTLHEPARTQSTANRFGFQTVTMAPVSAYFLDRQFGQSKGASVREPGPTVLAGGLGKTALANTFLHPINITSAAFLTKFQQNSVGQDLRDPCHTVMAGALRFGLENVELALLAYMAQHNGNGVIGRSMREPCATIMTKATQQQPVVAFLTQYKGRSVGQPIGNPSTTIETRDTHGLVAHHLLHLKGTATAGFPVDAPAPAIQAQGQHLAGVATHLQPLRPIAGSAAATVTPLDPSKAVPYETALLDAIPPHLHTTVRRVRRLLARVDWRRAAARSGLATQHATDPILMAIATDLAAQHPALPLLSPADVPHLLGLVKLHGVWWQIVDIEMRMLRPRELARIQSFPDDYIIDRGADGRRLTQEQTVEKLGNSVCPFQAAANLRANFPDGLALTVRNPNSFARRKGRSVSAVH